MELSTSPYFKLKPTDSQVPRLYGLPKIHRDHRAHTIEEDQIVVSFDVVALFTNVPIEDGQVIIKELLENDETLSDWTPLSIKNLLDLLEFLLHTTFFIFNGVPTNQQTEGVAMGEPPSSIVAEIYMQATETTALTTTSHPPKV